ncbi:MAG: His/Gly/Thr/Pro-type tRNA ligase C-terminal domain-containing protein, partial [candidate division WOR-3 bacterium]
NAAQPTICAGGRYDFSINQFDKQINFACGAALGVDRISEIISQPKNFNKEKIKIGIAIISDEFLTKSFEIIKKIFETFKDFIVVGPFMKRSLKSQMRLFNNENCKYVVIIGDELKENKITIKDFTNNTQKAVNITELTKFLTYYE